MIKELEKIEEDSKKILEDLKLSKDSPNYIEFLESFNNYVEKIKKLNNDC